MEWLKKILEGAKKKEDGSIDIEELMKQVNAEFPKNAVPKETYNTVSTELKTANTTIADLKKNNGDNEALQAKVEEYEGSIKTLKAEHEAKFTKLAREVIDTELLGKYKAKNAKAVKALIDEFEANDDADYKTLLDSKLKALSEADDTKFMFGEAQTKQSYNPNGGGDPSKEGLGANMAAQRNTSVTPSYDPWATK